LIIPSAPLAVKKKPHDPVSGITNRFRSSSQAAPSILVPSTSTHSNTISLEASLVRTPPASSPGFKQKLVPLVIYFRF
jgi:hypothetical protein